MPPPWVVEFLATLILTGERARGGRGGGIDFETAWALRAAEPEFATYWDRAVHVHRGIEASLVASDSAACATTRVH